MCVLSIRQNQIARVAATQNGGNTTQYQDKLN